MGLEIGDRVISEFLGNSLIFTIVDFYDHFNVATKSSAPTINGSFRSKPIRPTDINISVGQLRGLSSKIVHSVNTYHCSKINIRKPREQKLFYLNYKYIIFSVVFYQVMYGASVHFGDPRVISLLV